MAALRRVLVVGGGTGGLSTAILLRRAGVEVDLCEIQPEWKVLGSGLTMMGATIRALEVLGLGEEVARRGAGGDDIRIFDAGGKLLEIIPLPRVAGPGLPAMAGIMRPELHAVLLEAAEAAGVRFHLGTTVEGLTDQGQAVEATLTGGDLVDVDLVVGADGIHSRVRTFGWGDGPGASPTGQGCWRAMVPKPAGYVLGMFYAPHSKAGINAVSEDEAYLFLADNDLGEERPPVDRWPAMLRERLKEFGGAIAEVREAIDDPALIDFRPIQSNLVPPQWHRGRVVLIGDAAHAPTPQLAMGAGLAVEDAVVLAELLTSEMSVEMALSAFTERRYERCRLVVANSLQLGEWEKHPEITDADPGGLSASSWAALAEPI